MRFLRGLLAASAVASIFSCNLAAATPAGKAPDSYPSKMITVIVPYPAGGGTDIIARSLGQKLSEAFGVPVVVENKPGASGILGNNTVAKAQPDGYTLLLGITALIQTPSLYRDIPYNAKKDFAPVSELARSSDLLVVHKDVPANTIEEFISLAKSRDQGFSYGTYGNGTSSHLHGELLRVMTGAKLVAIPYKGAAPLTNDLLGGQVPSAFIDTSSFNQNIGSDRVKVLAITGTERHPRLPDVPTFAEAGIKGFEPNGWFGMFAPAGTPKTVIDRLAAEIKVIVQTDEFSKRLTGMGLRPVGGSPEAFSKVIENDTPYWAEIVKRAEIVIN